MIFGELQPLPGPLSNQKKKLRKEGHLFIN